MGMYDTVFVAYGIKQTQMELDQGFQTYGLDKALRIYTIHKTGHITVENDEENRGWNYSHTNQHLTFDGEFEIHSHKRQLRVQCIMGRVVKIVDINSGLPVQNKWRRKT